MKKEKEKLKKAQPYTNKTTLTVYLVLRALIIFIMVRAVLRGNYESVFLCALSLALLAGMGVAAGIVGAAVTALVLLPVLAILYLFAEKINIHDRILPSYIMLYLIPFLSIISLFWFCKNLPHIPVITYIGRYSLVVLGTHSIILGPVRSVVFKLLGESYGSCWLVLLAMVLLELAIIPIMIRLFPKFTAQEPLIKGRQQ